MSYGIEINNIAGKTLITDQLTNHFVASAGSLYRGSPFNANVDYAYPPPGAQDSDLILMRPEPDSFEPNHTRVLLAVDKLRSSFVQMQTMGDAYPDRFDWAIVRDFFNTQITDSGHGMSVFGSNGNCTYFSNHKESNVELLVTAEFLSSDLVTGDLLDLTYIDALQGTTEERQFDWAMSNIFGEKFTFQFESLDDIYVAAAPTLFYEYSEAADRVIGYFFDYSNNTIDCVRGAVSFNPSHPHDLIGGGNHEYPGTYGIYKITGLD